MLDMAMERSFTSARMHRLRSASSEATPLLSGGAPRFFRATGSIVLREGPGMASPRTGAVIDKGTVFSGIRIVTTSDDHETGWSFMPLDHTCYVEVKEPRGWAISRQLGTDEPLLEEVTDLSACGDFRERLCSLFRTSAYECGITCIIVVNAILIGVEIDHPDAVSSTIWAVLSTVFAIIYLWEVVLKMIGYGIPRFFSSSWNKFDFCVVFVTVLSDVLLYAGRSSAELASAAPIFRLLRLLRLTKFFRGLRILMNSFVNSIRALVWIFACMMLWFYVSACICTVFIGKREWLKSQDTGSKEVAEKLRSRFADIPYSMYTLFEVMTMEGWTDVVRPIARTRPMLVWFFILFAFIAAFILLNLVTAVVVDKTFQAELEEDLERAATLVDTKERVICDLKAALKKKNKGMESAARADVGFWLTEQQQQDRLEQVAWDGDLAEGACAVVDRDNTGDVSLSELQKTISASMRNVDMIALFRMQSEITRRMARNEELLRHLVDKEKPGTSETLQDLAQRPTPRIMETLTGTSGASDGMAMY